MKTTKEGAIDMIDTYELWNGHEPSPCNVSVLFCKWTYILQIDLHLTFQSIVSK